MKSGRFFLLALLFGLMAAGSAYYMLEHLKTKYTPADLVSVVQATREIAEGTVITNEMVELGEVPANFVHQLAAQKMDEVVGSTVISNISAGEIILYPRLMEKSGDNRLSYKVPSGKRAVSVAVNAVSGISGHLKSGDHIDVVAVVEVPGATDADPKKVYSLLALQDIQILAIGAEGQEVSAKTDKTTVTLAVNAREGQLLTLIDEEGKIRLALRRTGDTTRQPLPPLKVQDLLVGTLGG